MHNLKKILGYGGALARRDRGEPLEDPKVIFATLFEELLSSKKRKAKTQRLYRENDDHTNLKLVIGEEWGRAYSGFC
jgi:hypothetical protein